MANEALNSDYRHAHTYTEKYIQRVRGELYSRGLMLTSAMAKFAKFLSLPETDSKVGPICNIAFTALSIALPEVGLALFFEKEAQAAGVALAIAKAAGTKAPLAAKAAERLLEPKLSVGDWKEKITTLKNDVGEATADESSGAGELKKLDASRAAIQTLLRSQNSAEQAWEKTIDWLDAEMDAREEAYDASAKNTGLIPDPLRRIPTISMLEKVQT
ncbi:MAG: hypothetical protein WA324_08210, partial [Bryobacteraceae bacterium]